ncbi:hypothetical protein MMC22_001645 [Lobaria immixta]|nr:hypothetical protein [Lobaria immixta]
MDSQPVATGPSSEVIIGSVLLSKGGLAATIDGKVVSVDAKANFYPTTTVHGLPVAAASSGSIVVGSVTLSAGGSEETVSGIKPIHSRANRNNRWRNHQTSSGYQVITIGGHQSLFEPSTFPSRDRNKTIPLGSPPLATIIARQIITLPPSGFPFIIAGTTLVLSQALTYSGTRISLGSSAIFIGSRTIPLNGASGATPIATVADHVTTSPPPGFPVMIAGPMFTLGQAITVSGTRDSMC